MTAPTVDPDSIATVLAEVLGRTQARISRRRALIEEFRAEHAPRRTAGKAAGQAARLARAQGDDVLILCVDCRLDVMPMGTPAGSCDWHRYMVHAEVWAAAGMKPNGGWLCIPCLTSRLGRPLIGADLADLPVNEPGRDDDFPALAKLKVAARFARLRDAQPGDTGGAA